MSTCIYVSCLNYFTGALPISPALYGALNSVCPVARVNPTCRADDRNLSNCSSSDIEFEFQDFNEVGFRDVVGVRCEGAVYLIF